MDVVNIPIGPLTFDRADFAAHSDVLYPHIGEIQRAEGEETTEGHLLRFAPVTQDIVGLIVVGARAVIERDGRLVVTVPETFAVSASSLAGALQLA